MDFNIKNVFSINIGGYELWINETVISTWVIMAALILLAVVVRVKLKRFTDVPKTNFQNAIEAMVEAFDMFVESAAGPKLRFLGNWYFMVFAFILVSNISGLTAVLRPPTADWAVTFSFALVTFVLIQVMGVKYKKGKFFKELITPNPIFLPLNIIGELARPISLSFRLFGNIVAGMILITIYYSLTPFFLRFVIPSALHGFFDVALGALQTYIFCTLSLSFIGATAGTSNQE